MIYNHNNNDDNNNDHHPGNNIFGETFVKFKIPQTTFLLRFYKNIKRKNNSQELLSLKILKILKKNDSKEPAFLPSTTVPVTNGTRP